MGAAGKTTPLFMSSTFRDMHAERDVLNNVVFPALAERLRARRCRLEPIDLRVGVETADTQTERERSALCGGWRFSQRAHTSRNGQERCTRASGRRSPGGVDSRS